MQATSTHTYTIPRYRVSLVRETPAETLPPAIGDPRDASRYLRPLFDGLDREQTVVLCLDGKHRPIGVNVVSIGTLNESLMHPREVFKPAVLLNAAAIILAHNHPSGDPTPSQEDRQITRRMREAGEILGIRLLDHLVFGAGDVRRVE